MILEIEKAIQERKDLKDDSNTVDLFLEGLIKRYEQQLSKKNSDTLESVTTLLILTKKHLREVVSINNELSKDLSNLIDINRALEIKVKKLNK